LPFLTAGAAAPFLRFVTVGLDRVGLGFFAPAYTRGESLPSKIFLRIGLISQSMKNRVLPAVVFF
jgi:hypothetical protein